MRVYVYIVHRFESILTLDFDPKSAKPTKDAP